MRFATFFRWKVAAGQAPHFYAAWAELTELLKAHGSLGSALFDGPDGTLCAFARWPDRTTRDTAFVAMSGHAASAALVASTEETLERFDLDLIDDRWSTR